MLKKTPFIILFALSAAFAMAQEMEDIFDPKANITWLGLDFSGAKLIGDRERLGSSADVHHLMQSLNLVMQSEPDKFDVGLAIDKIRVQEDFTITLAHNESLDPSDMFSDKESDHFHLRPNDIIRIVAGYDFREKKGIGVMFVIESFNKLKQQAAAWVTFVDMEKKDVFFSERLTGNPAGFGLRNYWANAIYDMMKSMRKKEFEMWRKKYYRKF